MSSKTKVYVAVPTVGNIVDSQVYALREIEEKYKEHIEFVYPSQCVRRVFHDFARSELANDFMASDADILWFLDSDVTPPAHVMDLVAVHKDKWKAAGATYPVFMSPGNGDHMEVVLTVYRTNPATGALSLASCPPSGTDFVDGLATGCMFIKREVLEQLERPYFEFKFDPKTRNMSEGEDLGFCRKLAALGIKFFTDFSMVCNHRKTVDLLDVNNYAIMYSNRNVESYLSGIKADLATAIKQAYQRGLADGGKRAEKPQSSIWLPK
jgi:hypothetical protein